MPAADAARMQELVEKLVLRARRCPGLSPIHTGPEFLALARWQSGSADPASVAAALEHLWRFPADASTWVNQLLLESQPSPTLGPVSTGAEDPAWKAALRSALQSADRSRAA